MSCQSKIGSEFPIWHILHWIIIFWLVIHWLLLSWVTISRNVLLWHIKQPRSDIETINPRCGEACMLYMYCQKWQFNSMFCSGAKWPFQWVVAEPAKIDHSAIRTAQYEGPLSTSSKQENFCFNVLVLVLEDRNECANELWNKIAVIGDVTVPGLHALNESFLHTADWAYDWCHPRTHCSVNSMITNSMTEDLASLTGTSFLLSWMFYGSYNGLELRCLYILHVRFFEWWQCGRTAAYDIGNSTLAALRILSL